MLIMKMIRLEGAQEVVCRTQLYSLVNVFLQEIEVQAKYKNKRKVAQCSGVSC